MDNLEQSIAPPIHRGSWLRSNGVGQNGGVRKVVGCFVWFYLMTIYNLNMVFFLEFLGKDCFLLIDIR